MAIKPIRTEEAYNNAITRVDQIIDAKEGTPEYDELEVLSILSEAYEEDHFQIDSPDPIEALKCIMEWKGLQKKDLEPYIGSEFLVNDILNHKKNLTFGMIINLKKGLGISADLLISDPQEEFPVAV